MNTSYPPPHPVSWRVTDLSGVTLGCVTAQLWAEARAEAAVVFARDDLTVEPLGSSHAPSGATSAPQADLGAVPTAKAAL